MSHFIHITRKEDLMKRHWTLGALCLAALLTAHPAAADVQDRLDNKGDRIQERLDNKGDRINERLDKKGDRIEERLDNRAERARDEGKDGAGSRCIRTVVLSGSRRTHRCPFAPTGAGCR